MSGTYWSVPDCAWVACEPQVCSDPLGVEDVQTEVPAQREAVPHPVPAPVDA